ncbi:3-deoxy-7-phosphoheptulonate synthase [Rhizobium sp. BK226]|uniref:3-deoxy-7-phosphoheptulonate synthase n=1 Tax=Rhizobium TaxID=379 RepID=UPI0007B50E5E|nr:MULTISPECIES: 3-deoxy-7-phosphoheptulonate synthase [Rhizobium]KZS52243.1 phospho-2-dehydro-3-deoxyheptonate aldolase [Rhizobium anhuiense bv. trifolii]MBB3301123.1 3-deoxy-7-phosphoheptulonate synthase [Rhizobium sp. BK112]MBB3368746.1 3-deoxy-7-phosphoheptulonate synthase [Rhizobium sp. BK077]MBB4113031.1 3-deoxy-7-phosphoheptulonate synthase [Rhizobium sp. BK226]MBB4181013.1 3-deoxy-7-phosphoheptulonate synthase [Rhizobium sp. BK109]
MSDAIDDLRILEITPLTKPADILAEIHRDPAVTDTVTSNRDAIHKILRGEDDRLIAVIGPCSIHDPVAAREYAARLEEQRRRFAGDLEIVMRVYFEKPRTTVGWKGLINDPHLDGSYRIEEGLRIARRLLLDINAMGLPAGVEFLDTITPQYIADLVSWGAIGARTTESQIHRQLASGLSCPIGFKNGTDGGARVALDAILAASQPHHFPAVTKDGQAAIASTTGNEDCHIILRGGKRPNYEAADVEAVTAEAVKLGVAPRILIDASHANSGKDPMNQPRVAKSVAAQIAAGNRHIKGMMIESNLVAGRQDLVPGKPLVYGQSITDGCIDWDMSVAVLEDLAKSARDRRKAAAA